MCQIGGWTAYAALSLPVKWALFGTLSGALISLYREVLGLALTSGMYLFYREVSCRSVARVIALIIFLSFAGSTLELAISFALHNVFPFEEAGYSDNVVRIGVLYYRAGIFACWGFLYFALRLYHESKNLNKRLAQAVANHRNSEVQLLRTQMNPHFLFNALTTIRTSVERSRDEFRRIVQALSDYLRYSLDHAGDEFVALGMEFDATRNYLEIEKGRFLDELEVQAHIDPEAESAEVPAVILQPLVENAVKYGRLTSGKPLRVRVSVTRTAPGIVCIEVSNSGYWTEPENTEKSSHLGLHSIRRRLEILYGKLHHMDVAHGNGWVTVTLLIPAI